MLHFSCDLCGRQLDEERFVVKVEVTPAFDPQQFDEEDLDHDNLQEIAEMISEMEVAGASYSSEFETKKLRYDLCPNCRGRYLKDPLGRNKLRQIGLSDN